MHKLSISQNVIERIVSRRGRLHIVDKLNPQKAALLVIDMQNAYLMGGQPGFARLGPVIIPAVNGLAREVRRAGGRVVWVRNTFDRQGGHAWSTYGQLRTPQARDRMTAALVKGSLGHELSPDMAVDSADLIIDKYRYSAFIQGSSDLDQRLQPLGIDTLVIAGVLTNVCCESTARDAMMLNYRVVMAADATAAHSDEEYNASLTSILFAFGDVMTCREIIERLVLQSS